MVLINSYSVVTTKVTFDNLLWRLALIRLISFLQTEDWRISGVNYMNNTSQKIT